jgi:hypothetical protein
MPWSIVGTLGKCLNTRGRCRTPKTDELMAKKATEYRWKIYRLRGTPATFIGAVVAVDEKAAVNAAIKEFEIDDPAQQKRLLAQRD